MPARTLLLIRSCLGSLKPAMARDKVKGDVVAMCTVPVGQSGRPSGSLTLAQGGAVLAEAVDTPMYAYIGVSPLTGGRTEERRELTWDHVDVDAGPAAMPAVPPHVAVWPSARA